MPPEYIGKDNLRCVRCSPVYTPNNDVVPIVTPPACRYTDVPLSIQVGEILPFRWDIDFAEDAMTDSCDDPDSEGKVVEDSMQCTFALYNRDRQISQNPIMTTVLDCNDNTRDDDADTILFDYFTDHYLFEDTTHYSYGKYQIKVDEDMLGDASDEF